MFDNIIATDPSHALFNACLFHWSPFKYFNYPFSSNVTFYCVAVNMGIICLYWTMTLVMCSSITWAQFIGKAGKYFFCDLSKFVTFSILYMKNVFFTLDPSILNLSYPNVFSQMFFFFVDRGTRAQHLTLCVLCVVFPGWMQCSDLSERKDNCTIRFNVYSIYIYVYTQLWEQLSHE